MMAGDQFWDHTQLGSNLDLTMAMHSHLVSPGFSYRVPKNLPHNAICSVKEPGSH